MLTIVFEACVRSQKCRRAAVQDLTVSRHTFILHLVYLQTKANQSQPKSYLVNRQVRKSRSARFNGVKTHFHIVPWLPTDQSQPKPCPVNRHANYSVEACMRSHKCGRAAVQDLTVSRHTFILHLVYLQTKANQSHAPWPCIDLYTMACTSWVMCNLLHWLVYNGFYKLRHVQPLALTSTGCVTFKFLHWLINSGFYKLRHVQPLAVTSTGCVTCDLLHWLVQSASSATSCIDFYSGFYELRQVRNLLHGRIYTGFYKLRHVQPLASAYIQCLLQAASCATSCIGLYKLRHVQPLAVTTTGCVTFKFLHWLLQAASRSNSCIDLYTVASTSCVMCTLLHWIMYNGFYKLCQVQPLALTSTSCVTCNLLHWLIYNGSELVTSKRSTCAKAPSAPM